MDEAHRKKHNASTNTSTNSDWYYDKQEVKGKHRGC